MSRLRELQGSGSPSVAAAAATAHELSLEKDTWALLMLMNGVDKEDAEIREEVRRHDTHRSLDDSPLHAQPGPNTSDQDVFHAMRYRSSEFRRTEAVVEWLQDAADAGIGGGLAPAEGVLRGGGLAWSHTLESLTFGAAGQKSEVAQMHPDANIAKVVSGSSTRGGTSGGGGVDEARDALKVLRLVGQDDLDEEELLRTMWMLVRAGHLRRAKVMCEDRGQPWRAAAMAGGAVVGTRKEENGEEDGAVYSPGQGLWQEMCWQLRYVSRLLRWFVCINGNVRSSRENSAFGWCSLLTATYLLIH